MDEDSNHYLGDINKNNFSIKINSTYLYEGVDYIFTEAEGYNYVDSKKENLIKDGDTITIKCSLTKKMINSL
ncbi:MAG: hypothetical protein MJ200_01325 [Mycoplasmoidaceae bacterium]|nr:hypothetical protein [Mycoplasmoidaceae bacterium]